MDRFKIGDEVEVQIFNKDLSQHDWHQGKVMSFVPPKKLQSERVNIQLNTGEKLLEVDPACMRKKM